MKLLLCASCGDIIGLGPGSAVVVCECGRSWAAWVDPQRGIARYGGVDRDRVFGIGLHNGLLRRPLQERLLPLPADYKLWKLADGYVFKNVESMIAIFLPGGTSDTSFDPEWVNPVGGHGA